MFNSLEFTNFRGFRSLQLNGLQRVNLIVGRNNSGKTSLLEGLAILANPQGIESRLPEMFRPRPKDSARDYFRWLVRDGASAGNCILKTERKGVVDTVFFTKANRDGSVIQNRLTKHIWRSGELVACMPLGSENTRIPMRIISVLPRSQEDIVKIFAAAVRKRDGEEKLDELFHLIDERILKVRVIPFENSQSQVMFDFGLNEMVPMSQVGQGLHRLLTIFAELLSGEASLCIIDEIENGIHHSMLEQVWTGIAVAAEKLDIQVFATTHSRECIEAAHAAFSKRPVYDLGIVQLFRVEKGIEGRVLNREQIEAAKEGEIDLR